jgi:hypothetical protein
MKIGYDACYRFGPPWVGDARSELVELVGSGVLAGPAIDRGYGVGDDAILLAWHGFGGLSRLRSLRRSPGRRQGAEGRCRGGLRN